MRNNQVIANRIQPYSTAANRTPAESSISGPFSVGQPQSARFAKWNFRTYSRSTSPSNLPSTLSSQSVFLRLHEGQSSFGESDTDQSSERRNGPVSLETPAGIDDERVEVKCRILEAVLWVAREPLSARKLAALAGLADPTQARTLARRLNESYDSVGHAFRIEEVAGGMQMLTRPQFASWLRRLDHVPSEELLSQGMLESLSIIAYRQPTTRAEIEAIRGVNSDEVLRQLMQRDLVRICGRHEDLGRPYLYGTTKRFLQLFGLQSLDNLPRAQKIRQAEAEIASRLAANNPLVAGENTANIDHSANSVATSEPSSDTIFASDD